MKKRTQKRMSLHKETLFQLERTESECCPTITFNCCSGHPNCHTRTCPDQCG